MSRKRPHEDATEDVFVYYEDTDVSSIPLGIISLRIDSSVRKIPPDAFPRRSLINVEYEEGLKVIGERAFCQCLNLREQHFPSTLVEIGKHAFHECIRLESIGLLPLSLQVIRENAFNGCVALQSLEIPSDTIRLENEVFAFCHSLTHIRLPQGMISIPGRLFMRCTSLVDVNMPSSVVEIGVLAFAFCKKLAMIALPAGLKTIGRQAFAETGLKHFSCPDTVESTGDGFLRSCTTLESVILPPKLEVISEWSFLDCRNLKDVSIPKSVVQVRNNAFQGCWELSQLDLSGLNLTSVGKLAFADCSNLRDIILPRTSLKRIEEKSFEDCKSLTHLWVPPSVEYIDNGAFAGCTSLLSVEVPETLTHLIFVGYDGVDDDDDDDDLSTVELCGYNSLVNIYIPPSQQIDEVYRDGFMEEMKLGEAERSYPKLFTKLKRRFSALPLHRTCYFQSYHSLQENVRRIRSVIRADGSRACKSVDFLGMTPFHILALSHRPLLNLFQELLSVSSADIMKCRDVFGSTPLDYLCKNDSSSAVYVTKSLFLTITEPRVQLLGLDCWRDDVTSGLAKVQMADATSLATDVKSVCQKLAMLERMEVLSLLEMSIWRMKIEEENATGDDDRESCRINCGSSIVLEHATPFLGAE